MCPGVFVTHVPGTYPTGFCDSVTRCVVHIAAERLDPDAMFGPLTQSIAISCSQNSIFCPIQAAAEISCACGECPSPGGNGVDAIDEEIIRCVLRNARSTYAEIGEAAGLSAPVLLSSLFARCSPIPQVIPNLTDKESDR